MRRRLLIASLLLWCSATTAAGLQTPTFTSRVDVVRVDVLVTERGRPVPGLAAEDFELRDNRVLQQVDLVSFEQVPLNVVFVFDFSASVSGQRLKDLRRAGNALLDGLDARDRVALISFNQAITQESGLTPDLARMRAALDDAAPSGGSSVIDATFAGMLLGESDVGRALVIVFSDETDTSSWLTTELVLSAASQSDAVVYVVSPGSPRRSSFLRDLASATGGRTFDLDSTSDLASVFVAVLEEFRRRYLLTYTPRGVAKEGWHRLDVRVKRRGLSVKARPGYQAGPVTPESSDR